MSPISTNDLDKITAAIATAMQSGFAQISEALAQQPKAAMAAQSKTSAYRYGTFLPKGAKADLC